MNKETTLMYKAIVLCRNESGQSRYLKLIAPIIETDLDTVEVMRLRLFSEIKEIYYAMGYHVLPEFDYNVISIEALTKEFLPLAKRYSWVASFFIEDILKIQVVETR